MVNELFAWQLIGTAMVNPEATKDGMVHTVPWLFHAGCETAALLGFPSEVNQCEHISIPMIL